MGTVGLAQRRTQSRGGVDRRTDTYCQSHDEQREVPIDFLGRHAWYAVLHGEG